MHNVRGSESYLDVIYKLQKGTLVRFVLFEKLIGILLSSSLAWIRKLSKRYEWQQAIGQKLLTTFYQVPTCYHFIWTASDTEWKYPPKHMIFSKMNYTQRGGSINSGNIKNICIMKQSMWLDFSYLEAIFGLNNTSNCHESI